MRYARILTPFSPPLPSAGKGLVEVKDDQYGTYLHAGLIGSMVPADDPKMARHFLVESAKALGEMNIDVVIRTHDEKIGELCHELGVRRTVPKGHTEKGHTK